VSWRVADDPAGADAVVIATMGRDDDGALQAALASGAGYVGLVASARRGAAVLAELREAASTRKHSHGSALRPVSISAPRARRRSRSRSWQSSSRGGTGSRHPLRPPYKRTLSIPCAA